ncbi:MAG: diguanylate cyclase [Deltaproteobacteria bacterium]|nr:diguanylate cyclase [Deltaproteobacteria bacterium]
MTDPVPEARTLLVISDPAPWIPTGGVLGDWRLEVCHAGSLEEARALREPSTWDVIAFRAEELRRTDRPFVETVREIGPEATFLSIAGEPDLQEAISLLKHGVYEYLQEPLEPARFLQSVVEAIENREAFREILNLNRELEAQKLRLEAEKLELEKKNRELEAISRAARAVSSSLDLDEILTQLAQRIRDTFEFERIVIGLMDPSLACEEAKVALGVPEGDREGLLQRMRWFLKDARRQPWIRAVLRDGCTLRIEDPAAHPDTRGTPLAELHSTGFIKMPMVARGNVVGTITVENPASRRAIQQEDLDVLGIFADAAAMAVENARLYHTMKELAVRDELTGIYNRRHFLRQLDAEWSHALRHAMPLSLLMIDLDHFKTFNDGNDHLTGDAALRKAAGTFLRNTRGIDTVARYGGEEFVVILPRTSKQNGGLVAEKLRRAVLRATFAGEEALPDGKLTISVGVAAYPEDASTAQELLERADWSVYRAKADGRNRVCLLTFDCAPVASAAQ